MSGGRNRYYLRMVFVIAAALGLSAARIVSAGAPSTTADAAGNLHVPGLTIPPSGFWSPEFKQGYMRSLAGIAGPHAMGLPEMTAPRTEWQKFFETGDRGNAAFIARQMPLYPVDVLDTTLGGVRVGIIMPQGGVAPENRQRVLINLHGNISKGILQGQVESIPLAATGKIKIVTVDYRQEPEHKYPASSEDVEKVYRALLQQYKPEAIGIFGSSIGGILTAQAAAWFQAKHLPRPGALGVFWAGIVAGPFPWGGKWGDSMLWGLGVPQSDVSAYKKHVEIVAWYLQGVDRHDTQAYPGSSDRTLAQFPPTLLLSGTRAHDMSATVVGHARLLRLGVDASLYIMEGAGHMAEVMHLGTPEQRDVQTYITRWFGQKLAR